MKRYAMVGCRWCGRSTPVLMNEYDIGRIQVNWAVCKRCQKILDKLSSGENLSEEESFYWNIVSGAVQSN